MRGQYLINLSKLFYWCTKSIARLPRGQFKYFCGVAKKCKENLLGSLGSWDGGKIQIKIVVQLSNEHKEEGGRKSEWKTFQQCS